MDRIKVEGEKKDCKISLEKELDILSTSNHLISHPQMDVVINLKTGDIYISLKLNAMKFLIIIKKLD